MKDTPEYQAWVTGDNEANIPPRGASAMIAAIMEHLFLRGGKNRYQWQRCVMHKFFLFQCDIENNTWDSEEFQVLFSVIAPSVR